MQVWQTGGEVIDTIMGTVQEKLTDGIAVGAVTSPLWLDYVHTVSEVFSNMLPIFGVFWLGLQIVTHWRTNRRLEMYAKKEGHREGRKEILQEQKDERDGV